MKIYEIEDGPEILPCPFCGDKKNRILIEKSKVRYFFQKMHEFSYIGCKNCGAKGPWQYHHKYDELHRICENAIYFWNKRHN